MFGSRFAARALQGTEMKSLLSQEIIPLIDAHTAHSTKPYMVLTVDFTLFVTILRPSDTDSLASMLHGRVYDDARRRDLAVIGLLCLIRVHLVKDVINHIFHRVYSMGHCGF